MRPLKVLGIHGLGDQRESGWAEAWRDTILNLPVVRTSSGAGSAPPVVEFVGFAYDDIFAGTEVSWLEAWNAFVKLLGSGITSLFRRGRNVPGGEPSLSPSARDLRDRGWWSRAKHDIHWSAGYVVAWLEDRQFRAATRRRLLSALEAVKPDVVLAHSLGSLIAYEALATSPRPSNGSRWPFRFVSLGSQLGNSFVKHNLSPGGLRPLNVANWLHLYNREDQVFTAPIHFRDPSARFRQVETYFNITGWADHSATCYLKHPATVEALWRPLLPGARAGTRAPAGATTGTRVRMVTGRESTGGRGRGGLIRRVTRHRRKALLVAINQYADPSSNLEGCVNDAYLVSALLQENGYRPDDIRMVTDCRATTAGILERLAWLIEDARGGDERLFYYSGHGAQLPTYGEGDAVDGRDETLVPHDFDWSPARRITDDTIFDLYADLPYNLKLTMVFDCCHSGGIHRSGMPRARGLNPPDDIRHRELRWTRSPRGGGLWQPRDVGHVIDPRKLGGDRRRAELFCGEDGDVRRLGRGIAARASIDPALKRRFKQASQPYGPYLPVIVEACAEHELAFEYRHGAERFGAFTYHLVQAVRRSPGGSLRRAVAVAGQTLRRLKFDQSPVVLSPKRRAQQPLFEPVGGRL
mgnify:CR=1 FL=1